jgi:hypothetical protein
VTHLSHPLVAAARALCIRVGSEGMECCAAKDTGSGVGSAGSGADGSHVVRACSNCGCPHTGVCSDIRVALVLLLILICSVDIQTRSSKARIK